MEYFDLNVRSRSSRDRDRQLIVRRAFELGYSCIAWTTEGFGRVGINSASANLKSLQPVHLDPIQFHGAEYNRVIVDSSPNTSSKEGIKKLRQFSRITLAIDDMSDAQSITTSSTNAALKAYDIVAICPGTQQVFTHFCKEADVDIISIDFTHKNTALTFNKKLLDVAVGRGIHFEIIYSPLLTNSTSRRQVISNSNLLVTYLRGKNIIFSSGSDTVGSLRGPMDVANMAQILGLSQEKALQSVSKGPALVLRHAAARRQRFIPIDIMSMSAFRSKWPEIDLLPFRPDEGVEALAQPVTSSFPEQESRTIEESCQPEGGGDVSIITSESTCTSARTGKRKLGEDDCTEGRGMDIELDESESRDRNDNTPFDEKNEIAEHMHDAPMVLSEWDGGDDLGEDTVRHQSTGNDGKDLFLCDFIPIGKTSYTDSSLSFFGGQAVNAQEKKGISHSNSLSGISIMTKQNSELSQPKPSSDITSLDSKPLDGNRFSQPPPRVNRLMSRKTKLKKKGLR